MDDNLEAPAAQGASARALQFALAELAVLREVGRHALTFRELAVLHAIIACSLGRGRAEAMIPGLDYLAALSGLARPHVSTAVKMLRDRRILVVYGAPREGGRIRLPVEREACCYAVNILFQEWRAKRRPAGAEVMAQLALLETPPDLRNILLRNFVDNAGLPDGGPAPPALESRDHAACMDRQAARINRGQDVGPGPDASERNRPVPRALPPPAGAEIFPRKTVESFGPAGAGDFSMLGDGAKEKSGKFGTGGVPASVVDGVTDLVTHGNVSVTPVPHAGSASAGMPVTESVTVQRRTVEIVNPDGPIGRVTKSVTPSAVTESVTAGKVSPSHSPFQNVTFPETFKGNASRAESIGKRVSRALEARLWQELAEVVGEDVTKSHDHWRRVIRNFPDTLERALGEGRYRLQTGIATRNFGAWLNTEVAMYLGRKSMAGLPPGPPPV